MADDGAGPVGSAGDISQSNASPSISAPSRQRPTGAACMNGAVVGCIGRLGRCCWERRVGWRGREVGAGGGKRSEIAQRCSAAQPRPRRAARPTANPQSTLSRRPVAYAMPLAWRCLVSCPSNLAPDGCMSINLKIVGVGEGGRSVEGDCGELLELPPPPPPPPPPRSTVHGWR